MLHNYYSKLYIDTDNLSVNIKSLWSCGNIIYRGLTLFVTWHNLSSKNKQKSTSSKTFELRAHWVMTTSTVTETERRSSPSTEPSAKKARVEQTHAVSCPDVTKNFALK